MTPFVATLVTVLALPCVLLAPAVVAAGDVTEDTAEDTTRDPSAWAFGERLTWAPGEGPPPREHAAFLVDSSRDRAVMIAGSGYAPYGQPLGDAWAFDLADHAWERLSLAGDALTPGGARRAAVDGDRVWLHAGYGEGLREIDGLWTVELGGDELLVRAVPQQDAPPARMLHGFGRDPADGTLIVFGGIGGDDGLDDTWLGREADGVVHWRRHGEGEAGPGKRFGFACVFDEVEGRLLVCGGQVPPTEERPGMQVARDLWALDVRAASPGWTLLARYEADAFPGRRNPAWAFDQATGDLFVWGGTGDGATALADLYVVATREPGAPVARVPQPDTVPSRASCFGAVDAARGRALLGFGNDASGFRQDLVEIMLRRPHGEDAQPSQDG